MELTFAEDEYDEQGKLLRVCRLFALFSLVFPNTFIPSLIDDRTCSWRCTHSCKQLK